MTTQYTPAPWELRQSANGYWFIDYEQGGESYTLTKLECGEDDARLIAAAPDLLIALRNLLEVVEQSDVAYHPAHVAAMYALIKATGESK
jgi:hypothetical protein